MAKHSIDYPTDLFPWVNKIMKENDVDKMREAISCLEHKQTELRLCISSLRCALTELENAKKEDYKDEANAAMNMLSSSGLSTSSLSALPEKREMVYQ